jgi:hypothetical protein
VGDGANLENSLVSIRRDRDVVYQLAGMHGISIGRGGKQDMEMHKISIGRGKTKRELIVTIWVVERMHKNEMGDVGNGNRDRTSNDRTSKDRTSKD